ncbi:glycerol-3-phosphate dehydrogenase/oxidase [Magnetofaba australis]|uniref:Putative FAD dependent oxidoreductase n=1 Tax=Magnetofaba australis IT-1 TaxID=1434232 RepID=A0A1Y2K267_9PROT|nr:FAD-dependent oxidoreductase [Magnetofaba australis]OSM02103.1 putative FAD dependent oxidoreductase [Magnetofaba australis IT-1]
MSGAGGYDYDVAIIGAGIHGAGAAQVAALRGWSCVVLEREGVAAGTSSRSSKLIHGGLRYLENRQFGVVRECLRERARLLRVAPDLVRLIPFHLPVYAGARRPAWMLRVGLSLYGALAAGAPGARWSSLTLAQAQADGLTGHGLRHLLQYFDAQTDDAALTRAVMASAQSLGATLRCPAHVYAIHRHGQGVRLEGVDAHGGFHLRARAVINAVGPWLGRVAHGVGALPPLSLTQGAHLVLPQWPLTAAYTLQSPIDGRVFFVLPWRGGALLGTTETPFAGDPASAHCTDDEARYLLDSAAHFFPHADLSVGVRFAGVRALPAGDANRASRESLLIVDDPHSPRVVSLIGGKLTSYLPTAQALLGRIAGALPPPRPVADVGRLPLTA